MGANPPIHVMEGFVHRIWKNLKVDKVAMIHKGVFIVRFSTMENRDKVLSGHFFFDNKPLILKPWVADVDFIKEDLISVPVWIQLKLNINYWGEKALFKIVDQIGKPIQRDEATKNRDKVQFARVLVEVFLSEKLIDQAVFVNEYGDKIEVEVKYEWKPVTCEVCHCVGHETENCRAKKKQVWRAKAPIQEDNRPEDEGVTKSVPKGIEVDSAGFQRALRPIKVKACHLGSLYQNVFKSWCFTSNIGYHTGGRVGLVWKPGVFSVNILHSTDQFIHCYVQPISGRTSFFCTFIYAYNESARRESMWASLRDVKTKEPWITIGDLNYVRHVDERIGALVRSGEMEPINRCMIDCGLDDKRSSRYFFTWNNKQQGDARVFSKLDRIMANEAWIDTYESAEGCFMQEEEYDHTPALLSICP
ncbi:uncharacterized protein LOC104907175 [Beta vulgaris subsp. vulgaris]|uniref:uncharacterized protein LOC104907175 n=1 Tax=Beta vulgaris subsp. vulgaris TaxID=3555 RepID=UPI002037311A|nr:uncharacterized protein LOC104907175 [Beta vulgaris subsp. vulgaris]